LLIQVFDVNRVRLAHGDDFRVGDEPVLEALKFDSEPALANPQQAISGFGGGQ
jgi:hypothetical protein